MLGLTHELRPNRAREITFTQLTPWAPLYFGGGGERQGYAKKNDIQASRFLVKAGVKYIGFWKSYPRLLTPWDQT